MLTSAVALRNQSALNIFSDLRKNLSDAALVSQSVVVTPRDWKNAIIGFPSHNFDKQWIISFPAWLLSWELFEAIYATDEELRYTQTPPFQAEEQKGPKITQDDANAKTPDYILEDRVPQDNETVLKGKEYHRTGKVVKGASVYKKGDRYYYRDTRHRGLSAHLEVFDKRGRHLGEADPTTGKLKEGTADSTKRLNVR